MARKISVERNLKITIEPILMIDPVRLSKELQNTIKQVTEDLNLKWHRMASGAGHDAQVLGMVVPTAMIFVPSYQGRSHCPEEYTDWKDIENGANVLLGTILHLANT